MAAPAPPWPTRIRERAIGAEVLCEQGRAMLRAAEAHLAAPMEVADAEEGRARAGLVGVNLLIANIGLASAAATLAAADLLALRGAAADPTAPLPSVADIPDAHDAERHALGMLREARVYAEAAYDIVGKCCDRLLAAYNLLDHPGLPGVDGFVDFDHSCNHNHNHNSGHCEDGRMKRMTGVRSKQVMLWVPIVEMSLDGDKRDKIYFKSNVGIGRSFPAAAFADEEEEEEKKKDGEKPAEEAEEAERSGDKKAAVADGAASK